MLKAPALASDAVILPAELLRASAPPPSAPSLLSRLLPSALSSTPSPSPSAPHYVRLRYNAQPVYLPACAPEGKHLPGAPEVCTFEAFSEAVKGVELSQAEWRERCGGKGE